VTLPIEDDPSAEVEVRDIQTDRHISKKRRERQIMSDNYTPAGTTSLHKIV